MHRDKYTPRKRKMKTGNQSPFINKGISKAIMKRTELRNKLLNFETVEGRQAFIKKRNYYSSLNVEDITDNKKF